MRDVIGFNEHQYLNMCKGIRISISHCFSAIGVMIKMNKTNFKEDYKNDSNSND